jgi:hypothetical protein
MTYDSTTPVVFLFCIYADTALKSREMDHDFPFAAAAFSVGSMLMGNTAVEFSNHPYEDFSEGLIRGTMDTGLECLFASPGGLYYALSNRHATIDK